MEQHLESNRERSFGNVLARLKDVKVLPQVVYKIMEATEKAGASAGDLEQQIAVDPGFTAKILQIANSANYALPKRVTSIRDAVMLLGFQEIRSVAMKASVFDFFVGKSDSESIRRRNWWRTSVDAATICRMMADQASDVDSNMAYTAGLLHLMGRALLDQSNPAAYEKVMYVVERGAPVRLAERTVYAIDHIEVVEELANVWGFPSELVGSLNYQDVPETTAHMRSRAMVSVSHVIAEHLATTEPGTALDRACMVWAFDALGMTDAHIAGWLQAAQKTLDKRMQAA